MKKTDPDSINDEAVQWFVLLQDDDVSQAQLDSFKTWLEAAPEHQTAWNEVARLWSGLDHLGEKYTPVHGDTGYPKAELSHRSRLSSWKVVVLAACFALIAVTGWQLTPAGLMADYNSGVGKRQIVKLQDGSEVELGTASAIDVDFSKDQRIVRLIAGEAFFSVTKDQQRPFIVKAEEGQIRVLGTAFNVKIENGVTVAVTENTVEVSTPSNQASKVTKGEMVHYDKHSLSPVQPVDLETVQAWRQDQLIFKDTPLDEVLAEIQRYRNGRIQLFSASAGKQRVTAVFDARRTDEALDIIAASLGLQIYRATDLFVGITSK